MDMISVMSIVVAGSVMAGLSIKEMMLLVDGCSFRLPWWQFGNAGYFAFGLE
jgi:hypothetical protein